MSIFMGPDIRPHKKTHYVETYNILGEKIMSLNTDAVEVKNREVTQYISNSVNTVTSDSSFLATMLYIAFLKKEKNDIQDINNIEEAKKIAIYLSQIKLGIKKLEEQRKNAIFVHQNVVSMINSIFRAPRTALQSLKDHFSLLLGAYETKNRQEKYLEEQEKQKNAVHEQINFKPTERDIEPDEQEEIKTAVCVSKSSEENKTEEEPNIKLRESIEVTVLNPETLLKAILSIQERNRDYTTDLVNFNIPALKKLAKTKRVIPGCAISKANRAI
jgi:hypothetical protein